MATTVFVGRVSKEDAHVSMSVRRRPTLEQGMALEKIAHAIEYLLLAQIWEDEEKDRTAVKILMHASRQVFAECEEMIPLRKRFIQWVSAHFHVTVTRK